MAANLQQYKMTHRLLGHPRWSQHNFKRVTGVGGCSQAAAHNYAATSARPFSSWLLCCGNQLSLADAQQRRRQTPLMPSTVFATFRPQSTTPDAAPAAAAERESLHKKRKRYRTKFAELIQSECHRRLYSIIAFVVCTNNYGCARM